MVVRNYKFFRDKEGYLTACLGTIEESEESEFVGQMAQFREVLDSFGYGGWYKFEDGKFILDEERKALKLKEYEEANKG